MVNGPWSLFANTPLFFCQFKYLQLLKNLLDMKYFCTLLTSFLFVVSAGAQWTSNTSVNTELAALKVADLQTATTSDGRTWIAFYNDVGGAYEMRAQLLDANGNKLLGPNGVLVCNQPSGSAIFVFNIALDPSNNLVIGFQYNVAAVQTAAVTKVNTDGSLPWGANGTTLTAGLSPYVCVLSTNETIVVWNNNSPSTLYMQKLNSAGTPVWGAPVSVLVGATNTTRGQIIPSEEGYFTLVFQRKGVGISTTLYAQRYTTAGVAVWAAPVQLSTLTSSGARYYSILAENDTTYFGYYAASGSRFLSYVQRINPDGTLPYGINGAVFSTYSAGSDPYQMTTNIAKTPGSGYIWAVCSYSNTAQSQYGVFVQKFNASTGVKQLDPLGKEVYPITANRDQTVGSLNLVGDAPLFMHYEDVTYKIFATRLDASGNFVWPGNKVELSSTTAGGATPKGRFAFSKLVNNQAVAVWYENRGTEYRAYAQNITAAGNTGPAVLPVTLTDFKGNRNGKNVDLIWTTKTESNSAGFYLQRSSDGINFTDLGFVASKANGGNSSAELDYSFTDARPAYQNYYRLKQTDKDGRYVYSKVINIKFETASFILQKIYPSPASRQLNIEIVSSVQATISYSINDMTGRIMERKTVIVKPGSNLINVNISPLSAGSYLFKVVDDRIGEIQTGNFLKID